MSVSESSSRIEPCELESVPPELSDAVADLIGSVTTLGAGLHEGTTRGLAKLVAVVNCSEYKEMMDAADAPRSGDTDGRGNLSARALAQFVAWFVDVARDQVRFMAGLFDFERLRGRLRDYVSGPLEMSSEAAALVDETFLRGVIGRGEASRITRRPERTAREVLGKLATPSSPVACARSATPTARGFAGAAPST